MFVYDFVVIVNIYDGNVYATYSNPWTSYNQPRFAFLIDLVEAKPTTSILVAWATKLSTRRRADSTFECNRQYIYLKAKVKFSWVVFQSLTLMRSHYCQPFIRVL